MHDRANGSGIPCARGAAVARGRRGDDLPDSGSRRGHRGWVNELAEPNELVEDAIAVARELALLSPPAFAQTKLQLRAAVTERMARSREATDKVVTEIWAASDTLRCIRNYVVRTLKKN